MREKIVTRIEPNVTIIPKLEPMTRRKRVAAYARVSTASDKQMGSIEAQRDYYSKYIMEHANWDFVGIYADEGISGTSSKKRPAFQQMVEDSLAGKIDLILTKSLSRFARNTVDTLKTIRALKAKNVEVYFEEEDISTLDSKGEFLITLMSSLTQEESRSISENVAWGKRKRFADGKFSVPYKHFLGYDRGPDGTMVINEEQAEVIRLIYLLYLEGRTLGDITRVLQATGIKTPTGKDKWSISVIDSILRNEKYYGAALLQKKFTYDFLTKKTKKNCGELPQYYIENDHTPVVSKAHYDAAQERLAIKQRQRSTRTPFAGKLICDCCQQIYSRKSWHSTTTRDPVWECPQRFQGKPKCPTPHIYQQQLTEAYQEAFRDLLDENNRPIDMCLAVLKEILPSERFADVEDYFAAVAMREPPEMSYDPAMWLTLVERVIVCADRRLRFGFIDGHETVIDIPGRMRPHREITNTISEGATDMKNTPEKKERRLLSEAEKKEIIELKMTGMGSKAIAAQLHLSPNSVKTFIHRHGKDPAYIASMRMCPCCGARLVQTPGKKPKKFCSDACRMKWWAQHKEQMDRTLYTITCIQCRRSFETANPKRKFCGRACYADNRRKDAQLP